MDEVVDRRIAGERALLAQRVVVEARDVDDLEPGRAREARDLGRTQQAFVFVRAARHEPREIFRADDGERERLEIAIDGGDEHVTTIRAEQVPEYRDRLAGVRYVFEHFHARD